MLDEKILQFTVHAGEEGLHGVAACHDPFYMSAGQAQDVLFVRAARVTVEPAEDLHVFAAHHIG